LAAAGEDGEVRLWRTADLSASPRRLGGVTGTPGCLAFRPDGRYLAAGTNRGWICVWDLRTTASTPVVSTQQKPIIEGIRAIATLAFHPDGPLVSGGADGRTRIWDSPPAQPMNLAPIPLTPPSNVHGDANVTIHPATKLLAELTRTDGHVRFWDLGKGE